MPVSDPNSVTRTWDHHTPSELTLDERRSRAEALERGGESRVALVRRGGGVDAGQGRQYDVSRNGRFLINTVVDDATSAPITLVQHWRPPAR